MRNVTSSNLTAVTLTQNLKETVDDQFITGNEAFDIMNSFKSTPAYWKNNLHEVILARLL